MGWMPKFLCGTCIPMHGTIRSDGHDLLLKIRECE